MMDLMKYFQIRIPLHEVAAVVREIAHEKQTWKEVLQKYPKFEQQETKCV